MVRSRISENRGMLRSMLVAAAVMVSCASAGSVLTTAGFANCNTTTPLTVDLADVSYNSETHTVDFNVAGTSSKTQNVTAVLELTAYGEDVYSKQINPCDDDTYVAQLCPVPAGSFAAKGSQAVPPHFASMIPSLAFQVPDLASVAKLRLIGSESGVVVGCVQAQLSNGKTASSPVASYVAASVAGAALALAGIATVTAAVAAGGASLAGASGGLAVGGAHGGGGSVVSPSFTEVFGWMQGVAMNGMLSVNYPSVYRKFTQNVAFSTGIIPWAQLQLGIDNFRAATGGNITADGFRVLRNTTLVFPDGSLQAPPSESSLAKRAIDSFAALTAREIEASVNGSNPNVLAQGQATVKKTVAGITAFAEELAVPKSNTFMTVLLIVSIVIASIVVIFLLVKVLLEIWALFGSFPKSLAGFRRHYWTSIARTVTSLIMILYGIWVLYCIFQFTQGDSWAAKTLAGISLVAFSGVLVFFSWRIYSTVQKLKSTDGDVSALYEDKNIWMKYSLFYESYKKQYWWMFMPIIAYSFAKGCILATGDGHGKAQTGALLIVESVMFFLVCWLRPFEVQKGNYINIAIQAVRLLSVCCIFFFVEEFGVKQSTKSILGIVLIAIQSTLTAALGILIVWNAIHLLMTVNPHRKRRKELEKLKRRDSDDTLTPLDAHNSLLFERKPNSRLSIVPFGNRLSKMYHGASGGNKMSNGDSKADWVGPRSPSPGPHSSFDIAAEKGQFYGIAVTDATPTTVPQSALLPTAVGPYGAQPNPPMVGYHGEPQAHIDGYWSNAR